MATLPNIAPDTPPNRSLIAAPWHTLTVLAVFAYFGYRAGTPQQLLSGSAAQTVATHASVIRGYLFTIATEWGMAYWVWAGVHWKGGRLRDITGGRWTSWRAVATDIAIAVPFWIVWEFTAVFVHLLVDRLPTRTTVYHPPVGVAEVCLWILLSISAGVCEEIVFRGYFQRQFISATRSVVAGIVLQGLVFGFAHSYQGWKQVIVIATLGMLDGALVAWRGNLRASMVAHAWTDIFEGYLRFFLFSAR